MKFSQLKLILHASVTHISIPLIGKLTGSEVIALIYFPYVRFLNLLSSNKELRTVLSTLTLLLIVQLFSDFYNVNDYKSLIKGASTIVFCMISIVFLFTNLERSYSNIYVYLLFLFIVHLIFGSSSVEQENSNYFKVRFVPFLSPLVLLTCYFFYNNKLTKYVNLVFILYGFLCMSLDARSTGLVFILSAAMLYIRSKKFNFTIYKFLLSSVLISIVLYLLYYLYIDLVLAGQIGGYNSSIQLKRLNNPYNPFELLYIGRIDFFVLLQAGLDSFWVGHGSWAEDVGGKYAYLTSSLLNSEFVTESGLIRAHSVILGYFAYSGIFGGLLTFFLLLYLLFKSYKLYILNHLIPTLPLVIVLTMELAWNFLFSPIGYLRVGAPLGIALILVEYQKIKKGNKF